MLEKIIITFLFIIPLIYFSTFMITGVLFHKKFLKAQKRLNRAVKAYTVTEVKKYNNVQTIFFYLFISFIPIYRLYMFVGKMLLIFYTKDYIKYVKERWVKICEKK